MKTVLVVGYNTRHICASAKKAGFKVFSLEHFGDRDLFEVADKVLHFEDEPSTGMISELIDCFGDYDFLVRGPGFELWDFGNHAPVLNNSASVTRRVSDKFWLSKYLEEHNIPHPATWLLDEVISSKLQFPVMAKPRYGAGGIENLLIKDREQLESARNTLKDFIVQEYIEGITASVSLIASCGKACSIATSEQLSGFTSLTGMLYAYCGNITPFNNKHVGLMKKLAEFAASDLGLIGSNGVDFLVRENDIFFLEINPRFQGTLETVENAYDINVFSLHVDAFSGVLPQPTIAKRFQGKAVLFAKKDTLISKTCSDLLFKYHESGILCDVPWQKTLIPKDKPITTFFSKGATREETLTNLEKITNRLNKLFA